MSAQGTVWPVNRVLTKPSLDTSCLHDVTMLSCTAVCTDSWMLSSGSSAGHLRHFAI